MTRTTRLRVLVWGAALMFCAVAWWAALTVTRAGALLLWRMP